LCAIVLLRSIFISKASRINNSNNNINVAKLVSLDKDNEYSLGYDNTIGTSNRCDIKIIGRGVSKIHAQIYKKKDTWMLCTYAKKHTKVNEIKVNGRVEINSDDIIKLGAKKYQFILNTGDNI
jgi:hypothetical protein